MSWAAITAGLLTAYSLPALCARHLQQHRHGRAMAKAMRVAGWLIAAAGVAHGIL